MSQLQRGLGKGLDALLKGVGEKSSDQEVQQIPLSLIAANPNQPRRVFSDESLQDLAESIRSQGVLQPILVRNLRTDGPVRYELVAGERRWRASKIAGLKTIPALVRTLTDDESFVIAMIENLQREDLNVMDEAFGLQELQTRLQCNQETLAKQVGKSRPAIANTLRLLQLPDATQSDLRTGRLSAGHARSLLVVAEPAAQDELRVRIIEQGLSVRQAEALSAFWKQNGSLPAADATQSTPRPKGQRGPRAPKDAAIKALEDELQATLSLPVSMTGTREKGKIVLTYASEEQLGRIIEKLQP